MALYTYFVFNFLFIFYFTHKCIISYVFLSLFECKRFVIYNGYKCIVGNISSDVPHGSQIWPFLFYINQLVYNSWCRLFYPNR